MNNFFGNIEKLTRDNTNFRTVLYTGKFSQLVLMALLPGEEIGLETHETVDQFFRFEKGEGNVIVGDKQYAVKDGDAVIVPAGTAHNVINTSPIASLQLYTIYSPPEHRDGVIHKTKKEAIKDTTDHP
jgi:mannose-6-phosphate isomerase-like protein (cupin superfamily)